MLPATVPTQCPANTFAEAGTASPATASISCQNPNQICGCPSGGVSGSVGRLYYSSSESCEWTIGGAGLEITLNFPQFQTETDYDFVQLYACSDAQCNTRRQIAKLSGPVASTRSFKSIDGWMQVVFTSDSSMNDNGFTGSWVSETVAASACSSCPADSTSPAGSGTVGDCGCGNNAQMSYPAKTCTKCSSANYKSGPSYASNAQVSCLSSSAACECTPSSGTTSGSISRAFYGNNEECSWMITDTGDTTLQVGFGAVSTEAGFDLLRVYECSDATCSRRQAATVASLSGDSGSTTVYEANTGNMLVQFSSDSSNTAAGFKATWNSVVNCNCDPCPAGTTSTEVCPLLSAPQPVSCTWY
jgi:hypothetical protein